MSRVDKILWTDSLETNFEKIKEQLFYPRIIRLPDPNRPFILETDGSRVAVGAMLKQKFDDTGQKHPVGFFSRALSGSERNYAAYKVELYVVVRAIDHFRMFLLGKEFLLRTDHSDLRDLLKRDIPRPAGSNDGYVVSRSTASKLNTREAKTTSLQTSSFDCVFLVLKFLIIRPPIDKLPNTINYPVSEVPISNSSDKQSTSLYASESTSEYPQSDDDLSNSNISDRQFKFKFSDSKEIDLDDGPQNSSSEEFNFLDVADPLIVLLISREGRQAADFKLPTSEEIAMAQSTDAELKQLRQWIEE